MRLVLNDVDATPPGEVLDDATLARLYAYPGGPGGPGPWLRANMVSTLDGAATGPDGRTGSINNDADKQVFGLLRALADVIVVGAGTARAERYRQVRPVTGERAALRAGRPAAPALVVVSRTANLPLLLATPPDFEDAGEVLLATCAAAEPRAVDAAREALGEDKVLVLGDDGVDLPALVEHLAGLGMGRILTEGGPLLLRDVVAAGLLDELCLTVVPHLLAGEHPRILTGEPVASSLSPALLLEADGTLLGCWTRRR